MSLSESTKRRHALALVRRRVAAKTAKPEDLDRWANELGDVVYEIAGTKPPKKSSRAKAGGSTAPTPEAGSPEE